MTWIRNNWVLFSILVLIVSAGWIAFSAPPPGQTSGGKIPAPREGFLAPDFELQNEQGSPVRLSDLRGQPVLVNMWASWCGPCKAEMPAMQKVYEDMLRADLPSWPSTPPFRMSGPAPWSLPPAAA